MIQSTSADRAAVSAAASRLRNWLLHGPARLRHGNEAGAIAGAIDATGNARYAYAEITGYYLHWLSELAADSVDRSATTVAGDVLDWFCRRCADGQLPPTRIAHADSSSDWRNDASFCFDAGMLVNGVASALLHGIARNDAQAQAARSTLDQLLARLAAFARPDGLRAAIPLRDVELPRRWSTVGGAFLSKPAIRIAQASRIAAVPPVLVVACEAELARCTAASALAERPLLLHPLLYAAEGLAWAAPERAADIAAMLDLGLSLADDHGRLPETAYGDTGPRNDVGAQALRIGIWLQVNAAGHAPAPEQLDHLAQLVADEVRADGSIPFRPHGGADDSNVWCALFAEQALRWWLQWHDGEATARAELLV